jgi:hypothetical protein
MSATVEYKPLPPWPWYNREPQGEIVQRRDQIQVGSWALVYNEDFRVYRQRVSVENGRPSSEGAPIARYKYRPVQVTGETRVSWVCSRGEKYAKKGHALSGLLDVEDALWVGEHKYRIIDRLRYRPIDVNTLRQIADLIGYVDEDAP